MDLNDLASFVQVVEHGGFSGAARALGVPKSTVSRRVARLEEELGVELLRRSPRLVTPTADGRLLHARALGALRELGEVEHALRESDGAPRGTLVLTAPPDLGRSGAMAGLLVAYRRRHPEVTVEVRLEERLVDLVAEGVDVAVRAHGADVPGDGGLMVRSLGQARARLAASPEHLMRYGRPQHPLDLAQHPIVAHVAMRSREIELVRGEETCALPRGGEVITVNDFGLAAAIVRAGEGVALLPDASRVELEGLETVLPDWSARSGRLSLLWPASRHLSPRVRAFVELAAQHLVPVGEAAPLARRQSP